MFWLGLLAVPLIIAGSFLGLAMGMAGICLDSGNMEHPVPAMNLCVFSCGAIVTPAVVLVSLWVFLATLSERVTSPPLTLLGSIYHPPNVLAA
jgi:hypothetical protein